MHHPQAAAGKIGTSELMTQYMKAFDAGYRIFFLSASAFAVLAMIVWLVWLSVHYAGGMITSMPFSIAPHEWHSHEMVFGYGSVAVAGFLLTAAPNWTGHNPGSRAFFLLLFLLWLAGRLAQWGSGSLPWTVVAVADLVFMPVLILRILMMLLKQPKGPQMILLAVLGMFWAGNLSMHLEWLNLSQDTAGPGLRAGLYSLSALIVILGGRVTPAFTRNAMMRAGYKGQTPANPRMLAALSIALAILVPASILIGLPDFLVSASAIAAGITALIRLSMWRGIWTLRQPILWTLHLSYGLNAAGLIVLGLALAGFGSETAALHVTAIGGIGGMTVSVMSRATLGHSGRELVAPVPLAVAYGLLPAAMLLRFMASAWTEFYFPGVLLSSVLWIAAFTLFVHSLWPSFIGASVTAGEDERA